MLLKYLHALLPGVGHGPEFRVLESLWPDEAIEGGVRPVHPGEAVDILKWELRCPSCGEVPEEGAHAGCKVWKVQDGVG